MTVSASEIESIAKEKLGATHTVVNDTSGGCGQSFEVIIVSDVFDGKPLLQRHRLVNDALKDQIAKLHAFSQKTYTVAQWEQATK